MKTTFYLIKESIEGAFSTAESFESFVTNLFFEIKCIKEKDDELNLCNEIYEVEIFGCASLFEIFDKETYGILSDFSDRDVMNVLLEILNKTQVSKKTNEEVCALAIKSNTADTGFIFFEENATYDLTFQLIPTSRNWYVFKRHLLANKIIASDDSVAFIDMCAKVFPNIYFHEDTKKSIRAILSEATRKIVEHLTGLNDNLHRIQKENSTSTRQEILERLSSEFFDETASLEGNADSKPKFEFEFTTNDGKKEKVCCEPHLKLCYSDKKGDTQYSNNRRIYFHEGKPHIENGRILVGHIGIHL